MGVTLICICHLNCSERKPQVLLPRRPLQLGEEGATPLPLGNFHRAWSPWNGLYRKLKRRADSGFGQLANVDHEATRFLLLHLRDWVPRVATSPSLPHFSFLRLVNQNFSCYLFVFDMKCADIRHALFFFWPLNSGWGHMDSGLKLGSCFYISYSTLAFWFLISRFTAVLPLSSVMHRKNYVLRQESISGHTFPPVLGINFNEW